MYDAITLIDGYKLDLANKIINWLEAVVNHQDKVQNSYDSQVAEAYAMGNIIVSHTGGGGCEKNDIYDIRTKSVIISLPDTIEAMDDAWQNNWVHEDYILDRAHEENEFPEKPEELSWFLNDDDIDTERARNFLNRYKLEVAT